MAAVFAVAAAGWCRFFGGGGDRGGDRGGGADVVVVVVVVVVCRCRCSRLRLCCCSYCLGCVKGTPKYWGTLMYVDAI